MNLLPSPDNARLAALRFRKESTPAFLFKAVTSAMAAIPTGPVGKLRTCQLKMECDDQFFLSCSLNPHSAFTAASAS